VHDHAARLYVGHERLRGARLRRVRRQPHPAREPRRARHRSPGWTATATSYSYSDPAGTLGGIVSIFLRATPTFATGFRAVVKVQGRDLGAAADATIATAGLRVGNDCWSDTIPCTPHTPDLLCRGRSQP